MNYCEFINYFDPSIHVQLTIANRSIDMEEFRKSMLIAMDGTDLDEYRREYNNLIFNKAVDGRNSLVCMKYFTITVQADSYETAKAKLQRAETDIINNFRQMSGTATIRPLSGHERLEVFYSLIKPGDPFTFLYDNLVVNGVSTKDYIAPDYFDFSSRDYFIMDDIYSSTLFIKDYPSELSDKLIAEITDIECNSTVSVHFNSIDQASAIDSVMHKKALMEAQKFDEQKKASKSGYGESISPELKYSLEQADKLLSDLRDKSQRMFEVTVLINVTADSFESLSDSVEAIKGAIRKNGCKAGFLSYEQAEGFNSTLPIGKCFTTRARTMTTSTTAILIPFTTQELMHPGGVCYGVNELSGNLVICDRKSLKNGNGWFLGVPGGGKSMAAKNEMAVIRFKSKINDRGIRQEDEIIIIDPEREYTQLVKAFGGDVIRIAADSIHHINPLDITEAYSDDEEGKRNPLQLKLEFILSLCEQIAKNGSSFTGQERSLLDRAVRLVYGSYFMAGDRKRATPTMHDFYNLLKEMPEDEAQNLALALEIYIEGSLSVFSHQTTVQTNKSIIAYDISDLGGQLRTLGMLIVLDQIWNRITLNRQLGKRTWIYIDEIYLLVQNEYSTKFLFNLFRRARKWGAILTGITQNVEDLLRSDEARTMLSNSEFICMLNQAASDRELLATLFNLSSEQSRYMTNVPPGHGVLCCSGSIVPFSNNIPKDTSLYRLMTTNIDDRNEYQDKSQHDARVMPAIYKVPV